MPYIYKITNLLNQKIYIGQTSYSIEKRWKEHIADSKKQIDRPLYRAIQKYGEESFSIEIIEETDNPNERESFWIEHYGSFHNGYNATLGGEGRCYIDHTLVIELYNQYQNQKLVAQMLSIHKDTVNNILKAHSITTTSSAEIHKRLYGKSVIMCDKKTGEPLQCFLTLGDAARYILKDEPLSHSKIRGISAHIGKVCAGKRASAYGYIWKFLIN